MEEKESLDAERSGRDYQKMEKGKSTGKDEQIRVLEEKQGNITTWVQPRTVIEDSNQPFLGSNLL